MFPIQQKSANKEESEIKERVSIKALSERKGQA